MKITRNESFFIALSIVTVGLLFKGLDYYGNQVGQRSGQAMLVALSIAILVLFTCARLLLRGENGRLHKAILGLTYHAIPVVVAAIGWSVAYMLSDNFEPIDLAWIGVVGGGSLVLHWLLTRNKAKGISPKKAFL